MQRIQKFLAAQGFGSRRAIEGMIRKGLISVDGRPANLGQMVDADSAIKIRGRQCSKQVIPTGDVARVLIYNKPLGEICTRDDPHRRRTVFDSLPVLKMGRWVNVGRLDINTQGLLLFTNDGQLAHRLMHPSSQIERIYRVRLRGRLDEQAREKLTLEGIPLDGSVSRFHRLIMRQGSGSNQWYEVSLLGGKNREVRRLFLAVSVQISKLERIAYGPCRLPLSLQRGQWVELNRKQIRKLQTSVDSIAN